MNAHLSPRSNPARLKIVSPRHAWPICVLVLFLIATGFANSLSPAWAGPRPAIGVFLGTFDPPHTSHLTIALHAIERLNLDQLYLIPNYAPPHKPNATPFLHRHAMVRLLTLRHPHLHIFDTPAFDAAYRQDPLNINSVLIDDIRKLHGPDTRLYQIVGADALARMVDDHRLPAATESRILAAFRRSGFIMPALPALMELEHRGQLVWIDEDIRELSSTAVRKALAENRELPASDVPTAVLAYVQRQGMYGATPPHPTFRTLRTLFPAEEMPHPLFLRGKPDPVEHFVPASFAAFIAPIHLTEPLTLDVDQYLGERLPASISRLLLTGAVDLSIIAGLYPDALEVPRRLGFTELWPFFPTRERIDLVYLFGYRNGRLHLFVTNLFGRDRLTHTLAMFGNLLARNGLDPLSMKLFVHREFESLSRSQIDASLGQLKAAKNDVVVIGYRGAFEFMLGDLASFLERKGLKGFLSSGVADFEHGLENQRPLRMLVPAQGNAGFPWQRHTLSLGSRQTISFLSFRNCYGDQTQDLLESLIKRGFTRFILFGNGGALSPRTAIGSIYAATMAGSGSDLLTMANRAWPDFPARSVTKISSPLLETMGWLAQTPPFDLVDVEAFDLASTMIRHPEVKIYSGILVSDRPGEKDITRRDENHAGIISAKRQFFFCALQRLLQEITNPAVPSRQSQKQSPWVSPRPRQESEPVSR